MYLNLPQVLAPADFSNAWVIGRDRMKRILPFPSDSQNALHGASIIVFLPRILIRYSNGNGESEDRPFKPTFHMSATRSRSEGGQDCYHRFGFSCDLVDKCLVAFDDFPGRPHRRTTPEIS
jgi:hypothetical protein